MYVHSYKTSNRLAQIHEFGYPPRHRRDRSFHRWGAAARSCRINRPDRDASPSASRSPHPQTRRMSVPQKKRVPGYPPRHRRDRSSHRWGAATCSCRIDRPDRDASPSASRSFVRACFRNSGHRAAWQSKVHAKKRRRRCCSRFLQSAGPR